MVRNVACMLLIIVLSAAGAEAQEWAKRMFPVTDHDFGSVAKGAKVEFPFTFENLYLEDVHVVSVTSSCGCTSPSATKDFLKTYEEAAINAVFNTRTHEGRKSATLTVRLDKPFAAEVQLHVKGYIRSDVVLTPGSADLGTVDQGNTTPKTITVRYAGRGDWKIVAAKPNSPHVHASLKETSRVGGQVSYDLSVQLDPQAPVGYLKDQVVLVTDDAEARTIPVDVEARVMSEITVSPSSLFLGALSPGQQVTKKIVVQGKRPFSIKGVKCENSNFTFTTPTAPAKMHLIPVTYTAGDKAGKVEQKVLIETDLGGEVTPEFTAFAQVLKPEPEANKTANVPAK